MKGSLQQRSKGTWRLRYDGPLLPTGLRKQITETVRGTRPEAERVLRQRITAMESGGYVAKDKETVAAYLTRWLETYAATNTTARTRQGYAANVKRYIVPALGGVPVQALTGRQIQGLYAAMLDRGLSARTVLHVHRVLREALAHGVKWGLLVRNPADSATAPKPQVAPIEVWDVPTIHRFLSAAAEHPYGDFFALALLTGLRRSELAGLKWEVVDLEAQRLQVVRTLQRIVGRGLVEGLPKTKRSRRSLALSGNAVSVLHQLRGRQLEQQALAGDAWTSRGYVFTNADGTPIDPDAVTQAFTRIVRAAGLPHLTLHGLRHAHATLLLLSGVHAKVVSERLGHASIAITLDVYSHVLPAMQKEAADAVDVSLGLASQWSRNGHGLPATVEDAPIREITATPVGA